MMLNNFWKKIKKIFNYSKSIHHDEELSPALKNLLGFHPNNTQLFIEALTPRSAQIKSEKGEYFNYERLEFLGDAILGAVIADYLYENAPNEKEGYLTKMRSKIVSRKHLNQIGNDIGLTNLIDKKIKKKITLGNNISGDMFESLIGAIYEDQGFEKTREFIQRIVINPYVDLSKLETKISSYKTIILEWSQKKRINLSWKTTEEDNAEDMKFFVSRLFLDGKEISKGRGTSKKKAEENASKRGFYMYQNEIK